MIIKGFLWIVVIMCGPYDGSNEKYFDTFSDKELALSFAESHICEKGEKMKKELWEVSSSSKATIIELRKKSTIVITHEDK